MIGIDLAKNFFRAQRPEMRFVEPRSQEAQARAMLLRGRERLVHQRTELVNALRSYLYEFGRAYPQGIGQIRRIAEALEDPSCDLPVLVRDECRDILGQIAEKTERIEARTKKTKAGGGDRYCPAPANDARRWPTHRSGSRGLRATDGKFPARARLRGLAEPCAKAAFLWRQGAAGGACPRPDRATYAAF